MWQGHCSAWDAREQQQQHLKCYVSTMLVLSADMCCSVPGRKVNVMAAATLQPEHLAPCLTAADPTASSVGLSCL